MYTAEQRRETTQVVPCFRITALESFFTRCAANEQLSLGLLSARPILNRQTKKTSRRRRTFPVVDRYSRNREQFPYLRFGQSAESAHGP